MSYLFLYCAIVVVLLFIYSFTQRKSFHSTLRWVLCAVPILFFFSILWKYSSDVPFHDDYALLDTFHQMLHAPTLIERVQAFFKQVNEHRFAFERSVMSAIYLVFGYQSIKAQIIVGNLFSLGSLYYFYRIVVHYQKLSVVYLLPVILLIFSLLYYENAFWGIAAIQNTPIVFMATWVAYQLAHQTRHNSLKALIGATIISFISGNGLSVWIIGIIIFVLQGRFRWLSVWVGVAIVTLAFYFKFDYEFFEKDYSNLWRHPFYNILYVLAFWGNIFYRDAAHNFYLTAHKDVVACILTGASLFGVFLVIFYKTIFKPAKDNRVGWFLVAGMLFFLATGAMLVLGRPTSDNIIQSNASFARRYMTFGVFFAVYVYIAVLELIRQRHSWLTYYWVIAVVIGIGFNFSSYLLYIPKLQKQYDELSLDRYYYREHESLLSFGDGYQDMLFWNDASRFKQLIADLEKTGIYTLKPQRVEQMLNLPTDTLQKVILSPLKSLNIIKNSDFAFGNKPTQRITITVEFIDNSMITDSFLLLKSNTNKFIIPIVLKPNSIKRFVWEQQHYSQLGEYSFLQEKFPQGTYQLFLISEKEGNYQSYYTGKQLVLDY